MRWRARLRGNREKYLDGLLNDSDLTAAFDALLPIPGLWDGMMITTLHTMMSMKCDDVGIHFPVGVNPLIQQLGNLMLPGPYQTGLVRLASGR